MQLVSSCIRFARERDGAGNSGKKHLQTAWLAVNFDEDRATFGNNKLGGNIATSARRGQYVFQVHTTTKGSWPLRAPLTQPTNPTSFEATASSHTCEATGNEFD